MERVAKKTKQQSVQYVLAVSGGVDSAVLLDVFSRRGLPAVVAHFDHGIRPDSAADARFVRALAERYHLPFEMKREELGEHASEELARARRYDFLRSICKKYNAKLVTAHHQDDVIETILLNITRGTRWRGLDVMGDETIFRPFLLWHKRDIYEYAQGRGLEWCEDETNQNDRYTRNRLRRSLGALPEVYRHELYELWQQQRVVHRALRCEMKHFLPRAQNRYFMTNIDENLAQELLYELLRQRWGVSLLSAQLDAALLAIKTAKSGAEIHIGGGLMMKMTTRSVIIKKID